MSEVKKDLILRDLYYSAKTGFRSAQQLFELAIHEDPSFTLKEVNEWLRTQSTFVKYKTFNNPFFFRHTFVRYLGEQVQMDLIDLGNKFEVKNTKYLLVVIEILSRFAFAYPLSSKSADVTLEGIKLFMKDFESHFHKKPKLVQFDEGGEFMNKKIKEYFEHQDITYFVTYTGRKASIVERLNRTLRDKIIKLLDYHKHGYHWVSDLPDIIENYNTQKHSSIEMSPSEVNEHNQFTVWGRLFGHIMNHVGKPKFKLGDHVRVLHFNPKGKILRDYFKEKYPPKISKKTGKPVKINVVSEKGTNPFSEEVFRITEILMGDPIMYKLYSDEADVEILGKFYEAELSLQK